MGNFNRPEGQTTSDNFLKSEIEKDFLRAQSGWGELSEEELAYLGKKGLKTPAQVLPRTGKSLFFQSVPAEGRR